MLAEKRYIVVGLAAFIILVALAATSFRRSMKRMGKSWKRLHQLVYLAGVLAIIHFAWVVKGSVSSLSGDVLRPVLYGAVLTLLLFMRIPSIRKAIVRARQKIQDSKTGARPLHPPAQTAPVLVYPLDDRQTLIQPLSPSAH